MSTMKKVVFAFSVLSLAVVPGFAQNNVAQLEANKKLAQRFFDIGMRDPSKLAEIIHPDYIQHNPMFQRYNEEHGPSSPCQNGAFRRQCEFLEVGFGGNERGGMCSVSSAELPVAAPSW